VYYTDTDLIGKKNVENVESFYFNRLGSLPGGKICSAPGGPEA
jgi:hypothetical protein